MSHHAFQASCKPSKVIGLVATLTTLSLTLLASCGQPNQPRATGARGKPLNREEIFALASAGRVKEAVAEAERVLAQNERARKNEKRDFQEPVILSDLGMLYFQLGDYAKARSSLERAFAILRTQNKEDADIAQTILFLAKVYAFAGDLEKAEPLYIGLVKSLDKKGAHVPAEARALCLSDYAELCLLKGKTAEAEDLLTQVVKILERDPKHNMTPLIAAHIRLAGTFRVQARYAEALAVCNRSLELADSAGGAQKKRVADILAVRGAILHESGRFEEAQGDLTKCLAIQETEYGSNHSELVMTLASLGASARARGEYAEAERFYDRALSLSKATYGEKHLVTATVLGYMAVLYRERGDLDKAAECVQRSFETHCATLGHDNWVTAVQANNLADILCDLGRLGEAEAILLRALEATKNACGPESPHVAVIAGNLARLYEAMGKTDDVERLLESALSIRAEHFGTRDPWAADGLNNLAVFKMRKGDLEGADRMLEQALKVAEHSLGDDHPTVAHVLTNVIALERLRGRTQAAVEATDRARRIMRRHVPMVAGTMSLREQQQFQKWRDQLSWDAGLTLALENPNSEDVAWSSAGWVLNGKAIRTEILAKRSRLSAVAKDPTSASVFAEIRGVERTMASLILDGPGSGEAGQYASRLVALENRQRELVKQIATNDGGSFGVGTWVTAKDVQGCLSGDAVLIEVVRVAPVPLRPEAGRKEPAARFVAWLVTDDAEKAPVIVDLGDAGHIERAIGDVRAALQKASADIDAEGESKAEATLRTAIDRLSDLLIGPLSKHLAEKRVWLVSPDGALWLVPWEMLVLDRKYVVENHTVSYLVSGRHLLSWPGHRITGAPVVLADPDFDLAVDVRKEQHAEGRLGDTGQRAETVEWANVHDVKWPRLPGTKEESRRAIPVLKRYAQGQDVVALLGEHATERAFKDLVKGPSVLIASTHGFFVPVAPPTRHASQADLAILGRGIGGVSLEKSKPNPLIAPPLDKILANNPLLQCGLALAGANRRTTLRGPDGEDGILSGLEAASLDLAGTKLVILSACDTGIGTVHIGDGVSSLRQAFLIAGADDVVATHWRVPDTETADLVSNFVERFVNGHPAPEALRQAQLQIISERRAKCGTAHPVFWAAFTCTGHWRYPNRFEYRQVAGGEWILEERWSLGTPRNRCGAKVSDVGSLVPHGNFVCWRRDGTKWKEGSYVGGKRNGKWIEWHANGTKASEETYSEDRLSGPFTEWYSTGKLKGQGQYADGELSEKATEWDEETGIRAEIEWRRGRRHGLSALYNKDGVKVLESHYKNDFLNGTQTQFREDGTVIRQTEYSDGVVVEKLGDGK